MYAIAAPLCVAIAPLITPSRAMLSAHSCRRYLHPTVIHFICLSVCTLLVAGCVRDDQRVPAGATVDTAGSTRNSSAGAGGNDTGGTPSAPTSEAAGDTARVASDTAIAAGRVFTKHKGPWFDVMYPAAFKCVACKDEDGALFVSPDGDVSFYVFSPQWNGTSAYAALRASSERETDRRTEDSAGVQIRRFTYASTDGAGYRSFEDIENTELNTRRIFGVAYRNAAALARYRAGYLRFKKSLVQYAD